MTVPPWQEGLEASVLPRAYQDLLDVAADAGRPLRAAEFAVAAGAGHGGDARWGLDGAEAVLTLRAVISNGDFEERWRFHLSCEHQRLYPA